MSVNGNFSSGRRHESSRNDDDNSSISVHNDPEEGVAANKEVHGCSRRLPAAAAETTEGDENSNSDDQVNRVYLHGISVEEKEPTPYITSWWDVARMVSDYVRMDWRDLPVLSWGKQVDTQVAMKDLRAGVSLSTLLIPQALAFAKLTGVNNVLIGWYSSTLPLMIYALLGTSSQLAVGPTGHLAILIRQLTDSYSNREEAVFALAFLSGCVQLLLSLLGFGFVSNLLSSPVMSGYAIGAALIIAASQLGEFFGIDGTLNSVFCLTPVEGHFLLLFDSFRGQLLQKVGNVLQTL
eukprot:gb/GECG01011973.1/.p1 GENE.gb/GECG01011973.1/~~gb/GECG01011973.1/.p1  ORF type:complete len:294 (+),score=27.38 gb/GECG01011973.1/:1-882(+)